MNVDDVALRLAEIEASAGDDEVAHSMQDRLFRDVLRAIAEGMMEHQAAAISAKALEVDDLEFARWMA